MINKKTLNEYIQDNTQYGLYEEKPFIIFDSWRIIEQMNSLFQNIEGHDNRTCSHCQKFINNDTSEGCHCEKSTPPYYQKNATLDIGKLLGYPDSVYPFPLSEDDINIIIAQLEISKLIASGQTSFIPWEWSLQFSEDTARDIIKEWESNEQYQDDTNYRVELINDWIRDNIDEIEWGFSDEYITCSNCSNVIRTSPDSYGWQPDYKLYDGEILCKDCINPEDIIKDTQNKIDRGDSPDIYPDCLTIPDDFIRIPNPHDTKNYDAAWESGMFHGMNNDPIRQGRIVRDVKINRVSLYQVIFRIYPSQFYTEWDTFIRINPDIEDTLKEFTKSRMPEDLNIFSELFGGPEGKYPYDLASLYEQALKQIPTNKPFNKITVNPDEGTIDYKSFDNLDEFNTN